MLLKTGWHGSLVELIGTFCDVVMTVVVVVADVVIVVVVTIKSSQIASVADDVGNAQKESGHSIWQLPGIFIGP